MRTEYESYPSSPPDKSAPIGSELRFENDDPKGSFFVQELDVSQEQIEELIALIETKATSEDIAYSLMEGVGLTAIASDKGKKLIKKRLRDAQEEYRQNYFDGSKVISSPSGDSKAIVSRVLELHERTEEYEKYPSLVSITQNIIEFLVDAAPNKSKTSIEAGRILRIFIANEIEKRSPDDVK